MEYRVFLFEEAVKYYSQQPFFTFILNKNFIKCYDVKFDSNYLHLKIFIKLPSPESNKTEYIETPFDLALPHQNVSYVVSATSKNIFGFYDTEIAKQ